MMETKLRCRVCGRTGFVKQDEHFFLRIELRHDAVALEIKADKIEPDEHLICKPCAGAIARDMRRFA